MKRAKYLISALLLSLLWSGEALALTCTSVSAGNWSASVRWSCGRVPTTADTVVIAHNITLDTDTTIMGLTVNSGVSLTDDGKVKVVTVTSNVPVNVIINGTVTGTAGNGVRVNVTGATATISGNGTFASTSRLYISGTAVTLAAGSNLNFSGSSRLYAGRTEGGTTVANSVLTINGTINSTVTTATTNFMRLYASSTVVGSTGIINAAVAEIRYYTSTAKLNNNGSVSINKITQNNTNNAWTQGTNSSLTMTATSTVGVLNASASGNTVTYTAPAAPITPSANTYFNLAGTGVICPVSYIILGTSPCAATLYVQGSASSCSSVTGVGSIAWTNAANAYTSNNTYATALNVIRNTTTNYLNCTGFNLNVPSTASISGITVYVERKTSGGTIRDAFVYLIKGGVTSTAFNAATATNYTTADVIEPHGGQTNLWGAAWTVAELNATNFGVAFAARNTSTTSTNNRTITVDHIQVRVDYTLPVLHHIRIEHDGTASTCAAETITLKACANAACTAYYTGSNVTNIGLSPTTGSTWTPGSTATINAASGGINAGILLARSGSGTAALAITGTSSPAPSNPFMCYNTATATLGGVGSAACNLVFASNTFSFNVPDHTSATRQVATLTSCTAGFANTTRAIKFWSNYINPAIGTLSGKVVAGTGNADCATGYANLGTVASPTSLTLTFGAGTAPQATFSLCYPDVGDVRVDARYDGSVATSDNGVVITGNDSFIAKPSYFTLTNIRRTSDNFANPAAADATGAKFIAAGDATITETQFTATVTAKNALNATTPNYGLESTPEGIHLSAVLVAPSGGNPGLLTCNGATTGCIVAGGATNFSGGATIITDLAWSEVGILQIMPKIGDGNYLVTGEVTTPTASGNIGRFYPHHFGVAPAAFDNRADWCDHDGLLVADGVTACVSPPYTYMGEPLNVNFTLTAENASNTITQNYTGAFAKLNPLASGSTLALGAVDATVPIDLTERLDTSLITTNGAGSFSAGTADMIVPIAVARCTLGTCSSNVNSGLADGPYTTLDVGIAPVDSDGVSTVPDLDLNADGIVDRTQVNSANTEVRYGRIKLSNAFGSELLSLPLTATAQYWNGSDFITNILDDESQFNTQLSPTGNLQAVIAKGPLVLGNINASPAGAVIFTNGIAAFRLLAPNVAGSANLSIINTHNYLLPSVAGRATFGVYKGANEIIYMRENY